MILAQNWPINSKNDRHSGALMQPGCLIEEYGM